jgi:energy-coupling factor transport system ATP-binding protein
MFKIKELFVKYLYQKNWIFENASLDIPNPSCIGIIGNNGDGKTTLALTIIGTIPFLTKGNVSGDIICDGKNFINTGVEKRLEHISYVFQDSESQVLFGNVSNILGLNEFGPDKELIWKYVKFFGIEHLLERQPSTLSSGELQRVMLIGSLRNNPNLFIYDEVTSVLDPLLKEDFLFFVNQLVSQSKSVLLLGQRSEAISKYTNACYQIIDKKISAIEGYHQLNVKSIDPQQLYSHIQNDFDLYIDNIEFLRKNSNKFHLFIKDLEIPSGQNIAIVGVNGSGKTTFLNILYGLVSPKKFEIKINNKKYTSFKKSHLNNIVDYVFHNPYNQIICGTIREELGSIDKENEIKRLFPFLDYDSDPLNLSYGQLRMLCFLKEALKNKPILCIDEPEIGLDSTNFSFIQNYLILNKIEKKRTIIYSTHDLDFAKKSADRIILFRNGKICANELADRILSINEWFKSYNT